MITPTVEHPWEVQNEVIPLTPSADQPETPSTPPEPPEPLNLYEQYPPFPNPLKHPLWTLAWIARGGFGLICLIVLLAVLASIPILNLLALGYLLEAGGRVARTGKLRQAFPLLPQAARLGGIVLGICIWLVPVWLIADVASDAQLIAPGGSAAWKWSLALAVVSVLISVHLLLALAGGATFACFFRPLRNIRRVRARLRAGEFWSQANESTSQFLSAFRLRYHFWLGLCGFAGTAMLLLVPSLCYAVLQDNKSAWQWLFTLAGGLCLLPLLCWLPFLQMRLAAERRFGALFEIREVRKLFRHTPLMWVLATAALYGLAIAVFAYHFHIKLRLPPHETLWDVMLAFVVSIYPAKVFLGWAYYRATQRSPARWWWVWVNRLIVVALVGAYVFVLFFVPVIYTRGRMALLEHHPLLFPLPTLY